MNVPSTIPRIATTTVRRPPLPPVTSSIARHAILILVGGVVAYPFYFMLSSSLKPFFEAIQVPPTLFPHELHPENYADAWSRAPWARYFANTFLIASLITIGELVTAVLAAYAFARMGFDIIT